MPKIALEMIQEGSHWCPEARNLPLPEKVKCFGRGVTGLPGEEPQAEPARTQWCQPRRCPTHSCSDLNVTAYECCSPTEQAMAQ